MVKRRNSSNYRGRKSSNILAADVENSELVFTPAGLLDLLSSIEEFNQFNLGISESLDGNIQLQVGESYYEIASNDVEANIKVDNSVVDEISQINEDTYQELFDEGVAESESEIESGLIKELVKTLAVGGVVRLGKNYLKN